MRILLVSHRFAPDFGGIETVSELLRREWTASGHEVVVATQTGGVSTPGMQYRPHPLALWRQVRRADVVFHNHVCLRMSWPLALVRRPWVVTTQTWLSDRPHEQTTAARRKRWCLRRATNFYISKSIARHVDLPGQVIGNPYDEQVFNPPASAVRSARPHDLIFVGRLVSDKGADLLLEALARLTVPGPSRSLPRLTIIGDGPERAALAAQTTALGLTNRVRFLGALRPPAIARELVQHRCLVVPSRWEEPFGIVALEGLACGCQVVGSTAGGLPEAMGPNGIGFRNGDLSGMIAALERALALPADSPPTDAARAHLERHRSRDLARRYLQTFSSLTP